MHTVSFNTYCPHNNPVFFLFPQTNLSKVVLFATQGSISQCESVLWHLFVHPCSKTIPLALINLFTKQIAPSLCPESLTQCSLKLFSPVFHMSLIKGFLPSITFLYMHRFFLFVSFSLHTFSWVCGYVYMQI